MAGTLGNGYQGVSSPFCIVFRNLPEHIGSTLHNHGIHPVQLDAQLYLEMFQVMEQEWLEEAESLLPVADRSNCRPIIRQCFGDLLRAAKRSKTSSNSPMDLALMVRDSLAARKTSGSSSIIAAEVAEALRKWRHWRPQENSKLSPINQRQLNSAYQQVGKPPTITLHPSLGTHS